jgi:hypothetical protein
MCSFRSMFLGKSLMNQAAMFTLTVKPEAGILTAAFKSVCGSKDQTSLLRNRLQLKTCLLPRTIPSVRLTTATLDDGTLEAEIMTELSSTDVGE